MKAKDVVIFHARQWQQKYGENIAIPWSKATPQAARLLKVYPAEKLADYIRFYFTGYNSSFSNRAGHSFGAFIAELPAVIASYQEHERKRERAGTAEQNAERLAIARGRASE